MESANNTDYSSSGAGGEAEKSIIRLPVGISSINNDGGNEVGNDDENDAGASAAVGMYPVRPPPMQEVQTSSLDEIGRRKLEDIAKNIPKCISLPEPHPVWDEGSLKYTNANKWQSIPIAKREAARRERIHGVEVRTLPPNHFLGKLCPGQCGLFATQKFQKFDIVGEYTGKIVGSEVCGHYVACLEDKGNDESLGIDGEVFGSEMRFINSYLNIAFSPNVTMRTTYINSYPHIVIVCLEDIEIDDEFLLDYGEGYTNAFLRPKQKVGEEKFAALPPSRIRHALPGYGSDGSRSDTSDSD